MSAYVIRVTEDCEGRFYAERFWEETGWFLSMAPVPPSVTRGPYATAAEAEANAVELRDGRKVLAEWKV